MDAGNVVRGVLGEVLKSVKKRCSDGERTINSDDLLALNNLCGQMVLQALDLVDKSSIKLSSCPSGRKVYEVLGSSKSTYVCLTTSNFCSCLSFQYSVLMRGDSLMCKHLLAVHIADAVGMVTQQTVSDQDMSEMLKFAASSFITELL